MSRVVVLGSGIAGHTTAAFARRWLGGDDTVTVVSPRAEYNWLPANIRVGVGRTTPAQVTFPLRPVYERHGIELVEAAAREIRPEGDAVGATPFVLTDRGDRVPYDFLVNATGPQLRFDRTPGLGPKGNTLSVCTPEHAVAAAAALDESVERMRRGERQRFLVGAGHGTCACEGAALVYVVNLEFELRSRGVRDRAEITWITNEVQLGDFGMGGVHLTCGRYVVPSSIFTASLFAERGIDWIRGAHVHAVEPGRALYETIAGAEDASEFDVAMLLPPFFGVGLQAFDRKGADITERLFLPNGFMVVDADYTVKSYDRWEARDWPRTYQSPVYPNVFAAGIAFAPPHAISRPYETPSGAQLAPAPPRTRMQSAAIAKAVARNVVAMAHGSEAPTHHASMAEMGTACVASAGANPFRGTAASMTAFPIVPDFDRYRAYGRDPRRTFGEIGPAGHWITIALHRLFRYKGHLRPGRSLIPE